MAAASTARHETRALLRAHLAAASGYRHITRYCPVCHRLERLAMEYPDTADEGREGTQDASRSAEDAPREAPADPDDDPGSV
ncbi:DUF6274 family protein [Streptomyces lavendofoliae]|uniref:Uncharacterized protein n=1 Tax=Streptomyces lavendofoliae TaxID=67314 RepID=A0A918M8D3_9ACTN|nr:DUF6274 family protein [Streptomyces lavendofoliae]GGU68756.1 hypothetical protein GCM10010274_66250 [Streptomyces lavendofoliae]